MNPNEELNPAIPALKLTRPAPPQPSRKERRATLRQKAKVTGHMMLAMSATNKLLVEIFDKAFDMVEVPRPKSQAEVEACLKVFYAKLEMLMELEKKYVAKPSNAPNYDTV